MSNIQKNIKECPKKLWSYVKTLRGKSNYPKTLTYGSYTYKNGLDICNGFNKFFESVFVNPSTSYDLSKLHMPTCGDSGLISKIAVHETVLLKLLKLTDSNKSAGTDNVPPIFIHNCAEALVQPLKLLFQRSLNESKFPSKWKEANVVPVHKKSSKTKIENYRPISILNTFSKIFEKIVYDQIYSTIVNGISEAQHGFLRRRSTVSNLAEFLQFVLSGMERGGQVDVVYTDFEKAFDRVDHVILLAKLERLGIHGDLLRWVKSYLSNRSQAVVAGGFRSDFINIPSGIPQGSHLGPLLYNAYIFDIYTCFNSTKYLLYADDKKIFYKINNYQDCNTLQNTLNNLSNYYSINNITVNVSKCQQISFTRKRYPIDFIYTINNIPVEKVNKVRDLGVILDSKLTMTDHIEAIVDKAYKNLGFVLRTCKPFNNISCVKTVYYAYVRSVLEYASSIWSPYYITYTQSIEKIQAKFIKHLNYRARMYTDYKSGCSHHKIMPLEDRRTMLDAMLLYNIVNGHLDSPTLLSVVNFNVPKKRTRHTKLFAPPFQSTNYISNAPITRICSIYSKKFPDLDIFNTSKHTFKSKVFQYLRS